MDSEKYGDNCNILAEELLRQQKTDPPEVEELRELVATFPSSWQEIYRLVLIAGAPVAQVVKARGVTDMAIHKPKTISISFSSARFPSPAVQIPPYRRTPAR